MGDTAAQVTTLFSLYRDYGECDYLGESVTQVQHAIQCAMQAENEGFPHKVILGALLHDVGHLVGLVQKRERMETEGITLGVKNHERVGEKYLKSLRFPEEITTFVRGHVNGKRYLVYKDPGYHDKLSPASKMTLVHQGGPMTAEQAKEFEKHPQFEALVRMRTWDDLAKDPNMRMEPLVKYEEMCRNYLKQ
ncbi:uncharacterized protein LOC106156700 [Lingula anatina]|uniref:Uncharacterized protein LOC106156700 n=1 Tax=Lingula anatina TaxID=7574 RepID=A0A1S3HR65_LINAN|nr:uncharacterized protein LOC106156700 [Lingula anatina]XP_013387540.1 uncharacterized protein LOC106156700 [Lingula anatina]|eukprot:XP_013387539.1 uncharacterized protein LOC106156700 [Lingula anatina]